MNSDGAPAKAKWIVLLGMVCVGIQFFLFMALTVFSVDFVEADLSKTDLAKFISWEQWIILFCYRGDGYLVLLGGLWLFGALVILGRHQYGDEPIVQLRIAKLGARTGWITFLILNIFLFAYCGAQQGNEVMAKLGSFFIPPAGRALPKVSFLPLLLPLLLLMGMAVSPNIRRSQSWRTCALINLPTVLLVFAAKYHINFAYMGREVLTDDPGLRIGEVMVPISLALLFILISGYMAIYPHRNEPIVLPVAREH